MLEAALTAAMSPSLSTPTTRTAASVNSTAVSIQGTVRH